MVFQNSFVKLNSGTFNKREEAQVEFSIDRSINRITKSKIKKNNPKA